MTSSPNSILRATFFIISLALSAFSAQWHAVDNQAEGSAVIAVEERNADMTLSFDLPGYYTDQIHIDGIRHQLITAPEMTPILKTGAPDLPKFYRSVVIPDQAHMNLSVESVSYVDIPMKDLVPSKGNLTRDIDPATIPFIKGAEYETDAFYPQSIATLGTPYVMRDVRGVVVQIHPFRYNPVSGILRVYTHLNLTMTQDGPARQGLKHRPTTRLEPGFLPMYKSHFINFEPNSVLYDMPEELGRMLIIAGNNYYDATLPLVDWKRTTGIPVDILPVSEVGNNASAILNTVQSYYDSEDGLAFLLLVGDAADVAPAMSGGAASDPSYALLDGGNGDQYPDIFVGRFSANSVAQVETQVAKVISYESEPDPVGEWYSKAVGLASAEGAGIGDDGESDIQHMNNIRTDLLGYGYDPVDQIYDPGASSGTVSTAVNEGRGLINYVGHGSNTAWSTSGFSNTNVNALNNTGKLPVIFSVACVNGNFQSITCFAEAWLRAGSATDQRGAVAFYGSTINQSWAPPMCAEDEFDDLLVTEAHLSIGALMYSSSAQMIDEYGSGGFEMYATWHIFGDPSMSIRTRQPEDFTAISVPEVLILGASELVVGSPDGAQGMVCLSKNGEILDSAPLSDLGTTLLSFEALTEIDTCLLTVTGYNRTPWQQELRVIAPDGPYLINQGCIIADSDQGNGNGQLDFGETAGLILNIVNVGADSSVVVHTRIELDDAYVTLLLDSLATGCLEADSTLLMGPFSLSIAEDSPDGHQVAVDIFMDNGTDEWTSSLNLTLYAPQLELAGLDINDGANGRLDMGESASLGLGLNNLGGADLSTATIQLETLDPFVTITNGSTSLSDLLAGTIDTCYFDLTTQYATPSGHMVDFTWTLIGSNNFQSSGTFSLPVGLIIEDFESADFDSYDWIFAGHQNWSIVSDEIFQGNFSARSGTISHNQNSELSLTVAVDEESPVRFHYKISSQAGSDGLQFLVDGMLMDEWQGEIPWNEAAYILTPGDHELVWKYVKNSSGSSGLDCAWLDFITLPNMAIPGTIIGDVTADTQINVQDIVRLVNIILGQGDSPVEYELYCGDVNGDEVVDIGDLVLLVNFIMGDQMGRSMVGSPIIASTQADQLLLQSDTPILAIDMIYTGIFEHSLPVGYAVASSTLDGATHLIAYTLDESKAVSSLTLGNMGADLRITRLQSANNLGEIFEINAENIGRPESFQVYPNFPNPFNPTTSISFDLPTDSHVRAQIYDLQGHEIAVLLDQPTPAGHYEFIWDGTAANGVPLSSGLYFCHFRAGDKLTVLKMMLLK